MKIFRRLITSLCGIGHLYAAEPSQQLSLKTTTLNLTTLPPEIINNVLSHLSLETLKTVSDSDPRLKSRVKNHIYSTSFTPAIPIIFSKELRPYFCNPFGNSGEPTLKEIQVTLTNLTRDFTRTYRSSELNSEDQPLIFDPQTEIDKIDIWPLPLTVSVTLIYRPYITRAEMIRCIFLGGDDPDEKPTYSVVRTKRQLQSSDVQTLGSHPAADSIRQINVNDNGQLFFMRLPTIWTHPIRVSFFEESYTNAHSLENVSVCVSFAELLWSETYKFNYTVNERLVPIALNGQPVRLNNSGNLYTQFPVSTVNSNIMNIHVYDQNELVASHSLSVDLANVEAVRFCHNMPSRRTFPTRDDLQKPEEAASSSQADQQ